MGLSTDPEKRRRQLENLAGSNPKLAARLQAGDLTVAAPAPKPAAPKPAPVRASKPPAAAPKRKPAAKRTPTASRNGPRTAEPRATRRDEPPARRSALREFVAGLFD